MTERILFCIFFGISCLLPSASGYKHPERTPTPQEKETFTKLKKKFPGKLLDKDFKTLRELSECPEYLQFLSEAHPPEYLGYLKATEKEVSPFKTHIQFVKTALPPRERYFKFFKEQFFYTTLEDIQDEELAFIHLIATGDWGIEVEKRCGTSFVRKRPGISSILSQPTGIRWLVRKGLIEEKEKLLPSDWTRIVSVFMHLVSVVRENQNEDIRWIKTRIEGHGEDNGLLWIAVEDPFLFDRILYVFHDPNIFRKWIDGATVGNTNTSEEKIRTD